MTLAAFDLDNTLIAGDSDRLWGHFLVSRGYGPVTLKQRHEHYHRLYQQGRLDVMEFLHFQLQTLAGQPMEQLLRWREEYIEQQIRPRLLPRAARLIEHHRSMRHRPLIITATNRFLTEPIAALYGIADLLATEPELRDGHYTGRIQGSPCYAEGKLVHLQHWMNHTAETLQDAWFYSDSRNDLPLLERVSHPVAVDPDPVLQETAACRGWETISLRETTATPVET